MSKEIGKVLETVEIGSGQEAGTVIWLHGLGADGHDFEPIAAELALPFALRFVFPHAPVRPVTINGGARMRAWYDLLELGREGPQDDAGIRASAVAIGELIDRELALGLHPTQIVLAGFSQGGAIALHRALRDQRKLGGVIALSTYLPLAASLLTERSAPNRGIPIFMAHGREDPVIPLSLATASRDRLTDAGYDVHWHEYVMGHVVSAAEIRDLGEWLSQRFV